MGDRKIRIKDIIELLFKIATIIMAVAVIIQCMRGTYWIFFSESWECS